jgi:predicted nucleic acid-binding protein
MSGTDKPKIYYWDACVYLAWLKEERKEHGDACIEALNQIAKDNFDRKNVIITSTLTFAEVLSSKLSEDAERRFRRSFRNGDHIAYDVDPPIAMKAREFRETFLNKKGAKTLATPDAIHLATAAIYKADEVWTFDDGKKDSKHLGLLELNGDGRVEKLVIKRPVLDQPGLPGLSVAV